MFHAHYRLQRKYYPEKAFEEINAEKKQLSWKYILLPDNDNMLCKQKLSD